MDRMIYLAMTGASQTLAQQATVANNLANASTTGFRAEYNTFRAVPVVGPGAPTQTYAIDSSVGVDFAPGPIAQTGRALDIAVQGPGWITVQGANGSEAYTRDGDLQVSPNGMLETRAGNLVLGDGGPISIPPNSTVTIAQDGTVSTVPTGTQPTSVVSVGRIKLVNPPAAQLVKGGDGLFRLASGGTAPTAPNVRVQSGALEGSNVNVVDAMVSMIALARRFDMETKLMQTAQQNSTNASGLLKT